MVEVVVNVPLVAQDPRAIYFSMQLQVRLGKAHLGMVQDLVEEEAELKEDAVETFRILVVVVGVSLWASAEIVVHQFLPELHQESYKMWFWEPTQDAEIVVPYH